MRDFLYKMACLEYAVYERLKKKELEEKKNSVRVTGLEQ
jgi:hypothetical protein